MTLITIEIETSEDVAARLRALPEDERNHFATRALSEALEQREAEERDSAECVAAVEASIRDTETGGRLYTLEEVSARWETEHNRVVSETDNAARLSQAAQKAS